MDVQKQILVEYADGSIKPAAHANVFASTDAGELIPGYFYTETDADGMFTIPDNLFVYFITAQWQTKKITIAYDEFLLYDTITIPFDNTLPEVVIHGEATQNNTMLYLLLGLLALKTFSK